MAKRDYYEVLGVERDAADREIAKAYRKLAVKFHPDSNPGDEEASQNFKEAAEAYEVLSDQEKRARYDRHGHAGVDGGSQFGSAEDIFAAFGEMFGGGGGGGMFGDLFGGGGSRSRRGNDVRANVTLTLEEAAQGSSKTLKFKRNQSCEPCDGSGSKPRAANPSIANSAVDVDKFYSPPESSEFKQPVRFAEEPVKSLSTLAAVVVDKGRSAKPLN